MKAIFLSTTTLLFLGVLLVSVGRSSQPLPWRTSQYENVLGTAMEMKLSAGSQAAADSAEAAAIAEVQRCRAHGHGRVVVQQEGRLVAGRRRGLHGGQGDGRGRGREHGRQ